MDTFNMKDARAVRAIRSLFETQEQTRKSNRKVEVIAAGLPRCATSSLQSALQSDWLNYNPTFHMVEVLPFPRQRQLCIQAGREPQAEKRHKILQEMVYGYCAVTDFPTTVFAVDLMDMYPDAKIILNQRKNGAIWAKSVDDTIVFFQKLHFRFLGIMFSMNRDAYKIMCNSWKFTSEKMGCPNPYTGEDPNFGRPEFYDAWQNYIRREAKKRGREVLEWQPQDGWKPLCEFLGKPVPPADVPFPHNNETAELLKAKRILYSLGFLSWSLPIWHS